MEFFQSPHDLLANLCSWTLALGGLLNVFLDGVHDPIQFRWWNRPLLTSTQQARHHFISIESLATPVFFDDHIRNLVDTLVRSKPSFAFQTFAAAANRVAFTRLARVDNFILDETTERTFHDAFSPLKLGASRQCDSFVFDRVFDRARG